MWPWSDDDQRIRQIVEVLSRLNKRITELERTVRHSDIDEDDLEKDVKTLKIQVKALQAAVSTLEAEVNPKIRLVFHLGTPIAK